MNATSLLTIGVLSKQSGVSVETIRYYERIGLLPKPPRSMGGHRLYTSEHARRLLFIRRARALGFSLADVRALLGLSGSRDVTCAKVKKITEEHIANIRQKAKELRRLERVLTSMVAHCSGAEVEDCQIIDALARNSRGQVRRASSATASRARLARASFRTPSPARRWRASNLDT